MIGISLVMRGENIMSPFPFFSGIISLIYIGFVAVSIYLMVLMIKLSLRGIKALDIYIEKNSIK